MLFADILIAIVAIAAVLCAMTALTVSMGYKTFKHSRGYTA